MLSAYINTRVRWSILTARHIFQIVLQMAQRDREVWSAVIMFTAQHIWTHSGAVPVTLWSLKGQPVAGGHNITGWARKACITLQLSMGSMLLVHVTLGARRDVMLFMPTTYWAHKHGGCNGSLHTALLLTSSESVNCYCPGTGDFTSPTTVTVTQLCTKCPLEVKGRGSRRRGQTKDKRKHILHLSAVWRVSYAQPVLAMFLTCTALALVSLPSPDQFSPVQR